MRDLNAIAFVIPIFIILFAIEYYWAKYKKLNNAFKFENIISNISIGITERLMYLWTAVFFYKFFWVLYDYSFFKIPKNIFAFILLLFVTDFLWYWYHRCSHEINIFWAAHVVHHQSSDFNYSTGVRITIFQAFIRYVFWAVYPCLVFIQILLQLY